MLQGWRGEGAQVIPFALREGRSRTEPASGEAQPEGARGTVLLFTGVRYERIADPAAAAPFHAGFEDGDMPAQVEA